MTSKPIFTRVNIVKERFRQIQDLEFQIMVYNTDIGGLMVGMTPAELAKLKKWNPLIMERYGAYAQ